MKDDKRVGEQRGFENVGVGRNLSKRKRGKALVDTDGRESGLGAAALKPLTLEGLVFVSATPVATAV